MTTERWNDEMLDTLAGVVAQNAGDIAELGGIVGNFAQQLEIFVDEGRGFRDRMEAMQAEITGLRTETRRILERLEQHMSDGHGG